MTDLIERMQRAAEPAGEIPLRVVEVKVDVMELARAKGREALACLDAMMPHWSSFVDWCEDKAALLAQTVTLERECEDLRRIALKLRNEISDSEDELAQLAKQHEFERAKLERTRKKNADLEVRNATGKKVW